MLAIERAFEQINHACMCMFGFKINFEARITSMLKDGGRSEGRVVLDWDNRPDTRLQYVGICNKHFMDS